MPPDMGLTPLSRTIKQNLRIKTLVGTSDNGVKTQIWITVSAYVQVATVR